MQPSPQPPQSSGIELVEMRPAGPLEGVVTRITGYRETARQHISMRETASLTVPFILSFGEPFAIGLGRAPTAADRIGSFAAGLFAGPVLIESFGASHCLQIDFTPLGARRFFKIPMYELADRMILLDDVLGNDGLALREHLGNTTDWKSRFALAAGFVSSRIGDGCPPSAEVREVFSGIDASGGRAPVSRLATRAGWSRKHLAERFRAEIGLGPKSVARIVRFNRALAAARAGDKWADIAAGCGYADQAHLTREFRALAGISPAAWQAGLA
ncbi:AraC family transcriptional regulator [Mesorhizobium sp. LHD-90]|uniref:AraC family transcriptional regulator n=1 Tax=Mesorhizobium sp. LHD-90 TaxID=3071414 RepID=UPI0027E1F22F|nr:AraC family transcriptional regulator [Mesorhizobium sp. LHD-90]MDQ6433129.1 AraC family transcriptional regulator [Mesorhizobium sp. LHD-90]